MPQHQVVLTAAAERYRGLARMRLGLDEFGMDVIKGAAPALGASVGGGGPVARSGLSEAGAGGIVIRSTWVMSMRLMSSATRRCAASFPVAQHRGPGHHHVGAPR